MWIWGNCRFEIRIFARDVKLGTGSHVQFISHMTALEQYIQSYFGVDNSNDLKSIVSFFKPSIVKKGEYLLHADKRCDKLSFVESGLLRMYAMKDGNEITQWITTKGNFSADISSFLFATPSRSS